MNQRSVIVLNMLFQNTLLKRDSRIMLVFKYLQLFLIKMVESGICDDQANQAGIQGPIKMHESVQRLACSLFPLRLNKLKLYFQ